MLRSVQAWHHSLTAYCVRGSSGFPNASRRLMLA